MEHYFIGVDPGKTGAVAIINDSLSSVRVFDCPVHPTTNKIHFRQFVEDLRSHIVSCLHLGALITVLEKGQAMASDSKVAVFQYGKNCGYYEALLDYFGLTYVEVAAISWKAKLGLTKLCKGKTKTEKKTISIQEAHRLIPPSGRVITLKKHHNRAEAILLAYYAKVMFEEDKTWCL